jgi:2-phosphoglycerate kinase
VSERRHVTPLPLGGEVPFSKGLMARALVVTGLDTERAYLIAHRADRDLAERGVATLDLDRLAELAAETIGEDDAQTMVRRLKRHDALQRLEEPLLLLVGGATGTGKSTIATEAAHRLGITRVTSTDFIRQTMRAFFSEEFMPSVHYSSFEARLALTRAEEEESGDAAILGFLDQTRNVLVGAHAALERAATEHWSMVLEGVHLVPGMVAADFPAAFVVQCVVAIEDENLHRSHFWVREYATEGLRPLEKYLDSLPQIRQIQDYLVERARRYDVPVIVNHSLDRAIGDVMDLVLRRADQLVTAL